MAGTEISTSILDALERMFYPQVIEPVDRHEKYGGLHSYCYFIQCQFDGPVKIGSARDPFIRRDMLQIGNPEVIDVITVIRNAEFWERRLHQFFQDSRIHGEWFTAEAIDPIICELHLRRPW